MRTKKPYISIQKTGTNLFCVHALMDIPTSLEPETTILVNDGVNTKRGSVRTIRSTTLLLKLKPGTSSGIVHFKSEEFERDQGIDYIWVKVIDPNGLDPDDGAVGNYDDPDD